MTSTIQKKYRFIFYSSEDLNNLNVQVQNKNQQKLNKIDRFIKTISSSDTKVQFDRFLSFNDMITTLCTGYYLENNKSKLKMNASNNLLFKLFPMNEMLKNPQIMDQVIKKIKVGPYYEKLINNIVDINDETKKKIFSKLEKLEKLDQPGYEEDKKTFLKNLISRKSSEKLTLNNIIKLFNENNKNKNNKSNKGIQEIDLYCSKKNNSVTTDKGTNTNRNECFKLSYIMKTYLNNKNITECTKNAKKIIKFLRENYLSNIDSFLIVNVNYSGNFLVHNKTFNDFPRLIIDLPEVKPLSISEINQLNNEIDKYDNEIEKKVESIEGNSIVPKTNTSTNLNLMRGGGVYDFLIGVATLVGAICLIVISIIAALIYFIFLLTYRLGKYVTGYKNKGNKERNMKKKLGIL